MDNIIYLCMSYFEAKGANFITNTGKAVQVEYQNDNSWFWYSDYPYKLHHRDRWRSIDAFSEITKLKEHKKLWQIKCDQDMTDLLQSDEQEFYQIQVDTQDLTAHSKDVSCFLENYNILKVKSPMATRKSNIIEETIKQCNTQNKSVLFITNRVSLSHDIADKYAQYGLKHYQKREYNKGDNLVVQFDSLFYYNPDDFDVVILDEVSSLILYMTDTYQGKEERFNDNLNTFSALKTKQFLILDAFIINFPFHGKTLGIYNKFREELQVIEYSDKPNFEAKIVRETGKGLISVSSNEKRFLTNLEAKLRKRGYKVLMLTGDTKDKPRVYKTLEMRTIPYDAILYSPTLTVGVSIFAEIKHHFHYDNSGTISVIDSMQMTRRVRNAKELHYFIRGRASYKATDINNIERNLKEFRIMNEYGVTFGITNTGKMLAEFRMTKNILANSHKYAFRSLLLYQFKAVTYNNQRVY